VKCKEECLSCVGECNNCPSECLPKASSSGPVETTSTQSIDSEPFPVWAIVVISIVGCLVLCGAFVAIAILVPRCIKEKGPAIGIATSQHDVLFDDEDDVDLTPLPKKNKKSGDEDAFI